MSIEVFFDFVCPWCYIGHRKLEKVSVALPIGHFPTIIWRSYQLDPHASVVPSKTAADAMRGWYPVEEEAKTRMVRIVSAGHDEGLQIDLERAFPVNTFDAHRVSHLAKSLGLADLLHEYLFRAYHVQGLNIADHETLIMIAGETGMNRDEVKKLLQTDSFSDAVRDDISRASRLGVTSVPTLVADDGQRFSVVQEHSVLVALLRIEKGNVEKD